MVPGKSVVKIKIVILRPGEARLKNLYDRRSFALRAQDDKKVYYAN